MVICKYICILLLVIFMSFFTLEDWVEECVIKTKFFWDGFSFAKFCKVDEAGD
jgi:hypothetical protein